MSCCSDICHASHIIRCKKLPADFEICQDCIVSTRATTKKTSTLTQFLLGPGHPLYGAVEERLNEKLAPLVGKSSLPVDAVALQNNRSGIQWLAARSVATTNPVGTVSVWNGAFIERSTSIRWKARRPVGPVTARCAMAARRRSGRIGLKRDKCQPSFQDG